jgi:hypothetical protein
VSFSELPDAPVYCPSGTMSPQRFSNFFPFAGILTAFFPSVSRRPCGELGFRALRKERKTIVVPDNRSEGSIHLRSAEVIVKLSYKKEFRFCILVEVGVSFSGLPDAPVYCPSGTLSPQRFSNFFPFAGILTAFFPPVSRRSCGELGFRTLRTEKRTIVAPNNRSEGSIHLRSAEVIATFRFCV